MEILSTKSRLSWLALTILLLVLVIQPVWAQEEGAEDATVETEISVTTDEEVIVTDETEEEAPETVAPLTHHLFLPLLQQQHAVSAQGTGENGDDGTGIVAAFTQQWNANPCSNAQIEQFGLWDDVPGAGLNNDAALFWFREISAGDEVCSYYTNVPGVVTTNFPQLRIRVAVSDGSSFTVRVYRFSGNSCNTVLRNYTPSITQSNNLFYTRTITLTTGYQVCRIEIRLTDEPNDSAADRVSAMIDYIELRNASGGVAWQETFSNNN